MDEVELEGGSYRRAWVQLPLLRQLKSRRRPRHCHWGLVGRLRAQALLPRTRPRPRRPARRQPAGHAQMTRAQPRLHRRRALQLARSLCSRTRLRERRSRAVQHALGRLDLGTRGQRGLLARGEHSS